MAGRTRCWLGLVWLVLALSAIPAARPADPAFEYKVKAGFLFNFLKFVEWPPETFAADDMPFLIGVLDNDPAAPVLRQAFVGKTVNGRKIEVRSFPDPIGARVCQLLFLSRAQQNSVDELRRQLKGAAVLTVSETEQFCQRGGMINFVRQDESLRFEINLGAIKSAGLNMSSKLASMAIIVKETP
jgi:hypothetical protein